MNPTVSDISKADILCLSLSRHDAPISSPALSLAKELSKNNRVFFIDHPYSLYDIARSWGTRSSGKRKQGVHSGNDRFVKFPGYANLTVAKSPVMLPVNYLPAGAVYDSLSAMNNRRLSRFVHQIIRQFGIKDFIFINFFDPFYEIRFGPEMQPLMTVYQCMDDIDEVAYTARHGSRLQRAYVEKADITLCTSMQLTNQMRRFSPRVHLHPNAVDYDLFSSAVNKPLQRPAELREIEQPIVGFTGSLEYRTNFELLASCVERHKDKAFCFIGPVDESEEGARKLRTYPNVMMLPAKPIEELPAYLACFDCAIIPYKCNKLTSAIYPLKLNEYLAAGKPVVCTAFSNDLQLFADVIYLANDEHAFISSIDHALSEHDAARKTRRQQIAQQNSWLARVAQFWNILKSER